MIPKKNTLIINTTAVASKPTATATVTTTTPNSRLTEDKINSALQKGRLLLFSSSFLKPLLPLFLLVFQKNRGVKIHVHRGYQNNWSKSLDIIKVGNLIEKYLCNFSQKNLKILEN